MPRFDIDGLKARGSRLFAGFTAGQKAILGLAFLAVVLGGWMFTKWSSTTPMVPLFSNLAAEDASAVTQELVGQGVAYELADGGATVMVPRTEVYQLRLDLSAAGLPSEGNAGYSLLDEQGITTSEFRQRVDYQRALEGELANTIGAIDGVAEATVHVVIPEDDLFSADESKPTASVLVRERPGSSLNSGQVRAVVHLVASSVEGLTPEDVTVADAEGNVLNAPGEDGMAASGDIQSEQTLGFEQSLGTNIESLLVPLVGDGGAVVRVKATLDFDKRSTTTESFDEEGAPVVSETTTNETFIGEGTPAQTGVLGPDAPITATVGGSEYEKEAAERTFAVGKVTETVQAAPGSVERLSVAVLVDGAAGNVDANAVEALVTAAAGLDAARGDTVVVEQAAFDTSDEDAAKEAEEAAAAAESKSALMDYLRTGGAVLIVLVVLFLAWRSAKRSTVQRVPLAVPIGPVGASSEVAQLPVAESTEPAAVGAPAPVAIGAGAQLGQLIERQPDDVAQMLRGWLADRRS